jgi:hypothetical protein
LDGSHDCKKPQGRTRLRWVDSITADVNGIWRDENWNTTARPKGVQNVVMNFGVIQKDKEILANEKLSAFQQGLCSMELVMLTLTKRYIYHCNKPWKPIGL